ncbi:MAG: TIGR03364 family FAD-dependent oxidoreductase [Saprospiraceae bacterium]|nr:TIGR03364 family FAD-dependent oxidoreductase [Saprospiraceae bacterium]MCB9320986.1 TIGR03364 family FAD-dependent oxidoreductase [Lewinellaceae bacterium]
MTLHTPNVANYDLLIVGGGILGTFHAYHALRKGLKVVLLEKDGLPRGATVRNFGQVVPSGMNAKWQPLGRKSLEIYQSIQRQFDISARKNGSLYLASDEDEMTLLEEMFSIHQERGYPCALWTATHCLHHLAALRDDYCVGGLYYPEEITLEPTLAIHRVLHHLQSRYGLHYRPNTPVLHLDTIGNNIVAEDITGTSWKASQAIVCTGADFNHLFPHLFAEAPLELCKLHMMQTRSYHDVFLPGSILSGLTIRRYESFHECPSYASIKSKEADHSLLKEFGIHILFKQALDGSLIIGDSHEYAPIAERHLLDYQIDNQIQNAILQEAQKLFQLPDWTIERQWYGIYTQCTEGDIFETSLGDRIHIITGIGGKGMTASPGYSEQTIERLWN